MTGTACGMMPVACDRDEISRPRLKALPSMVSVAILRHEIEAEAQSTAKCSHSIRYLKFYSKRGDEWPRVELPSVASQVKSSSDEKSRTPDVTVQVV
jgi:hypothetical protein